MRPNLWTEVDTLMARRMLARKATDEEFLKVLGRTKSAAFSRIQWLDCPMYRDRKAERKRRERAKNPVAKLRMSRGRTIPDGVLEDRDRRNLAPRSITAFVFGDPAPGHSALDLRNLAIDSNKRNRSPGLFHGRAGM